MSSHRFIWRAGAAALILGILSACQSHTPQASYRADVPLSGLSALNAADVFAYYQKSADANAKLMLTKALSAHLAKERTVVSHYYYQERPAIDSHSLNQEADSLVVSILKTKEHLDQKSRDAYGNSSAYGDMNDYLAYGDADEKLYLRYYDEIAGTAPSDDYNTTRNEGMGDAVQGVYRDGANLQKAYKQCITQASYDIDAQIAANPAVTTNDAAVHSILSELDSCLRETHDEQAEILSRADAYQRADLSIMRTCATGYQKNIQDALAGSRAITRYEGNDFDAYDSIYANYGVCASRYNAAYANDPFNYMLLQSKEQVLKAASAAKMCADNTFEAQAQMVTKGYNYQNNPKFFEQSLYQHAGCLKDEVVSKVYGNERLVVADIDSMYALNDFYRTYESLKYYDQSEEDGMLTDRYGRFAQLWQAYFEMKQAELDQDDYYRNDFGWGGLYGMMMGQAIKSMRKTPEQMLANNAYKYNNSRLSVLSKQNPVERSYQGVVSFDFNAPTAMQSVQLPFALDFNQGLVNVDTSVVLPISALISQQHTPLPQDFQADTQGVMAFYLPDELKGIIPMSVVHDALVKGFGEGINEIHDLAFSHVDIKGDAIAKQLGASTVIKLNLNLQQQGELLAIIAKRLVADLSTYVDAHPQLYPDEVKVDDDKVHKYAQNIKTIIARWALIDKGFVSSDVGGLMQLIDALLPVDFYQSNYYYLDAAGNLVGQVVKNDINNQLLRSRTQLLGVISYRPQDFANHPLSAQVLPAASKDVFDGNAWAERIYRYNTWRRDARYMRYDYHATYDYDVGDESSTIDAALAADEVFGSEVKEVDFGQ